MKELRDRLFRKSRPVIRPLEIYDGDEYHKDIKLIWVAHKQKPFYNMSQDITQKEFVEEIERILKDNDIIVSEDYNKQYKGIGVVGVGGMSNNGWKFEPHVEFFPWATKGNILRTCVAFFQFMRYSRKVGCCVIYSLKESKNLFDHCVKYGVLTFVGRIKNGDPRGDEYLYNVAGRKK